MSLEAGPEQRIVVLGRLSGLYGVQGWLKVYSDTEPREGIIKYPRWGVKQQGSWREIRVEQGRRHGKGVVVKLKGIDDRDAAAKLLNAEVAVDRNELPEIAPGEYYWTDLEGLTVVCLDGTEIGKVDHLVETGANDVLVVKGDRERLIPYIPEQVIKRIDLDRGEIQVDWDPEF